MSQILGAGSMTPKARSKNFVTMLMQVSGKRPNLLGSRHIAMDKQHSDFGTKSTIKGGGTDVLGFRFVLAVISLIIISEFLLRYAKKLSS
jgi:hypothetical protein